MAARSKQILKASGRDGELEAAIKRMGLDDVNVLKSFEDGEGRNVLHRAVEAGAVENVRYLVQECGFPVSLRDSKYKTPLMYAAKFPDILEILLAHGASASEFKANSWTPLHYAAKSGLQRSVQLLLQAGAEASVQNKEGASPLYVAAREGHCNVISCLLESTPPLVTLSPPPEAHAAASAAGAQGSAVGGMTATVDDSTRVGALITQATLRGRTPLHAAIVGGHAEALALLLEALTKAGFSPLAPTLESIVDASGQSLQHEASEVGSTACAAVLLELGGLGPWPQQVGPDAAGRLPIHIAALHGHHDVLTWQLKTRSALEGGPGSSWGGPSFLDEAGTPALYHACSSGATSTVELLLQLGSDPLSGNARRSCLHIAAVNGHTGALVACVGALRTKGVQEATTRQLKDAEGIQLDHCVSAQQRATLGWEEAPPTH